MAEQAVSPMMQQYFEIKSSIPTRSSSIAWGIFMRCSMMMPSPHRGSWN